MSYLDDSIRNTAELSSTIKHFLLTLSTYADTTGVCWPSEPTVARAMSMSTSTVKRCIKECLELRLLTVRRRWRKSNVYRLLCVKETKLSPMGPSDEPREQPSLKNNVSNDPVDNFFSKNQRRVSPREVQVLLEDIRDVMPSRVMERNTGWFIKIIRSTSQNMLHECLARVRQSILESEFTGEAIRNPSGLLTWMLRSEGAPI